ncbi:MAG TPA: hypothetical protein VNG51_16965, partial [Ktedonobacteraceae bacterium]|nr:hypothetical protein [Ktedonobacteraceae bacterium]
KLLAAKMAGAVAAISRLHKNFRMVVKHRVILNIFFTLWKSLLSYYNRARGVIPQEMSREHLSSSQVLRTAL